MKIISKTGLFGSDFVFLKKINSTNLFLKEKLAQQKKNFLKNGTTVWAWEQTQGYGRYNRKWQSQNGKTATFSFLLESFFFKKQSNNFILSCHLNQIIALTIVLFLKKQFNIKAEIKFPNDVYVNKKKICGILIENISEKKNDYCIVGIGLNLFSLQNDDFCSIEKEKKNSTKISFSFIFKELLNDLQDAFFFYCQNDYFFFKKKINNHQMILNKEVIFYQDEEKQHGKIIAINDDFSLLVKTLSKKQINVFYDDRCQINL